MQWRAITSLGRPYYLLFSGGILSDIGSFTTQTALILHIYQITGENASFMGLAAIAGLAPMVVAAPLGGVWSERYNRRRIMVANDLIRIPLVLVMILAGQVWSYLALQALISASTALFLPSRQAIIPEIVGEDQIHLANSMNGGVMSVVHVLGPVSGAMIYAFTGSLFWILILDATTYLASALLLLLMPYHRRERGAVAAPNFLREIIAGFKYVHPERDLLCIFTILMIAGLALGLLIPLLRPFINEILHGDDRSYGYLIGAFGFGGMLGPLVGYWAGRTLGLGRTLFFAFLCESVLMSIWSRVDMIYLSGAVLFIWGVVVFTLIPCYMSYIHTYAKPEFMGRTFALFDQSVYMPQMVGAGVVIAFGNRIPAQAILTAAGLFYIVMVLSLFPTSGARLLRSRQGGESPEKESSGGDSNRPSRQVI